MAPRKSKPQPRAVLPRITLTLHAAPAYAFRVDDPQWSGIAFIGLTVKEAMANARRAVALRYKGEAVPSLILGGVCIMCDEITYAPHEHMVDVRT